MAPLFQRLFTVEEEVERPKAANEGQAGATHEAPAQEPADPANSVTPEPQPDLIPASKLPPAADTLAELFSEAPSAEEPGADEAVQSAKVSEMAPAAISADAAPK